MKIEDILAECIEEVKAGRSSVDDCLAKYPSLAKQLAPLLRLALEIQEPPEVKPSTAFKVRARVQLMEQIHAKSGVTKWRWFRYSGQKKPTPYKRRFNVIAIIVAIVLAVSGLGGGTVYASQGSLPGDVLYPVKLGSEAVGEFFTFDPEAKALLQTKRALTRIGEIEALLEIEGVEAPGLDVAQEKIRQNMAKAARILEQLKAQGIEIAQLAKRLDDEFDAHQDLLKEVFDLQKETLNAQAREIRLDIREAREAEDFEKIAELRAALAAISFQKEMLDAREDLLEEILEAEEARIEAELEAKEKELEALAEAAEDLFDQREKDLERAFKQRERALELQEKTLELQLKQAILVGGVELASQIWAQLLDLEQQAEVLEQEKELAELALEQEEERLRGITEMRERAAEQIEDAREEIADVIAEIAELVDIPPAVLELVNEAESKLATAEQVFAAENYSEAFGLAMAAEMLSRNAERILEEKMELVEKLEEWEEALAEVAQAEAALEEAQRRLEQATEEEREELEKAVEEARQEYEERLKEIEEAREKVGEEQARGRGRG
ncbi:DUF5667 domain-containing protein [candidate division NPL-UPA2 bacterium]|nr:DUF5667 domain-containing protein [candidate division NPL-UPA2 bacterium]